MFGKELVLTSITRLKQFTQGLLFFVSDRIAEFRYNSHASDKFKPEQIQNILIIGFTGIGDTLLFTPVFRCLRRNLPHAKITFITSLNGSGEIVSDSGFVDKVIVSDFHKLSWASRFRLALKLRRERFDCTLTVFGGLGYPLALFAFWTGTPIRIGHRYNVSWYKDCGLFYSVKCPSVTKKHNVENNLDLVKSVNIDVASQDKVLFIHITESDREYAKRFLSKQIGCEDIPLIGMHPGTAASRGKGRRWSLEKFANLADRLIKECRAQIMFFFGPDEQELANEIVNLMVEQPIIVKGLTLRRVAALIQQCSVFVSTDSGLGHIAAALQIPTVAIFGPANPIRTRPYGKQHVVITHELECSPCFDKPRFFTCTHRKCLSLITVDEVFHAIEDIIAQGEHKIAKSAISNSLQSIL